VAHNGKETGAQGRRTEILGDTEDGIPGLGAQQRSQSGPCRTQNPTIRTGPAGRQQPRAQSHR
jgi:hypothetical protein